MAGEKPAGAWAVAVGTRSPLISVELLLLGTWAILVPYLGRTIGLAIDTRPINEVVDHVIPGIAILVVAALSLLMRRRTLAGSLVVLSAGIWMTATHIPLLRQASDGAVSTPAALWHSIPGIVILAVGALACIVDAVTAEPGPPASAR